MNEKNKSKKDIIEIILSEGELAISNNNYSNIYINSFKYILS